MNSAALRAFYLAKPLIPRRAQVAARRVRARRLWRRLGGSPLPPAGAEISGYPWPDGVHACALVTHDVETAVGQANIPALLELEDRHAIRSCWNFVVRRYEVDVTLIAALQRAGHEVGVHGVYHDGHLFDSAGVFGERLAVMQEAAARWGAVGFRSPSLIYDSKLLETLPFTWDSSMPAWDPFQPKHGDCLRYFPFAINDRCVELPVTLWQDFTLFEELGMRDIDVWRRQIDVIYESRGLINVIVHPDYMLDSSRLGLYAELLAYLKTKQSLWITTPTEVAAWETGGRRALVDSSGAH